MRLDEALRQIAADANLNADQLIKYASEDNLGGRDTGHFPGMSTFSDEGRVIYALVRALHPERVVEVGVDSGGTSTHILSALEANGTGALWSVDINPDCGAMVPAHLRPRWTFVNADALTTELPEHADFIFEDGEHGYPFTFKVLTRLKALNPRMLLSHDYYTHLTYGDAFQVQRAFTDVLGDKGVLLDGAFTGLGYWVNSGWANEQRIVNGDSESDEKITGTIHEFGAPVHIVMDAEAKEPDPIAAPKPKRAAPKRKAKAAK